jgi:CBS domain-containing protein
MTLREVLHAHIPFLSMHSTVRDAVDKMDIYQFPALVIVNEDQKPVGVVTEGDLCRAISGRGSISEISNEPVHRFGTSDPTTAGVDTEISDALHQMLVSGLSILPVVLDGRLMGVVLRVDLMQAMLMDRAEKCPQTS